MTPGEKVDALSVTLRSAGWIDVIKPCMEMLVDNYTKQVMENTRSKETKDLPDAVLKERVFMAKWILEWESKKAELIDQLEQALAYQNATIPAETT